MNENFNYQPEDIKSGTDEIPRPYEVAKNEDNNSQKEEKHEKNGSDCSNDA